MHTVFQVTTAQIGYHYTLKLGVRNLAVEDLRKRLFRWPQNDKSSK